MNQLDSSLTPKEVQEAVEMLKRERDECARVVIQAATLNAANLAWVTEKYAGALDAIDVAEAELEEHDTNYSVLVQAAQISAQVIRMPTAEGVRYAASTIEAALAAPREREEDSSPTLTILVAVTYALLSEIKRRCTSVLSGTQ